MNNQLFLRGKRLPRFTDYQIPPAARCGGFWAGFSTVDGLADRGRFRSRFQVRADCGTSYIERDFPLGIAVFFAVELGVSWLGTHSMFRSSFKRWLRWLVGIPVNRNASRGVVGDRVEAP